MKIKLSGAGKRFNREWIFRKANLNFEAGQAYAVTGANGSGKSTLLQCIGGMLQLSEGSINVTGSEGPLYRQVAFCAPYLELIEEMTLREFLGFHHQFKPFLEGFSVQAIIAAIGLEGAAEKQIRNYSSGMKQRVKLAQAILFDAPVLLLDEPCTNLDAAGIDLYHALIQQHCLDRLVIVCSNDEVEYRFCTERINMSNVKM